MNEAGHHIGDSSARPPGGEPRADVPDGRGVQSRALLARAARTAARATMLLERATQHVAQSREMLALMAPSVDPRPDEERQRREMRRQLQRAIALCVRDLKDERVAARDVLDVVKATVHEAVRDELSTADTQAMVAQVSQWAVDCYYSAA